MLAGPRVRKNPEPARGQGIKAPHASQGTIDHSRNYETPRSRKKEKETGNSGEGRFKSVRPLPSYDLPGTGASVAWKSRMGKSGNSKGYKSEKKK